MDLTQLNKFIKQLNNSMRMCATQGCPGELIPTKVSTFGLGGAVSIKYNCNGCGKHEAHFETSSKNELYNTSDISMSVQVAFIRVCSVKDALLAVQLVPLPTFPDNTTGYMLTNQATTVQRDIVTNLK